MSPGEVAERLWGEVTSRQPLPDASLVLLSGAVALALVWWPTTWPLVRLGVTVVHEAGHAAVAVLVAAMLVVQAPERRARGTSAVAFCQGFIRLWAMCTQLR